MSAAGMLRRQSMQYQESHLEDNQTRNLGSFYIILIIITAACMGSRLFSRTITRLGLERDDWAFLIGSTIAIGCFVVSAICAFDAGLGEHWVALTPNQAILALKLNYASNILVVSSYPIIKLSILLLYLRIFISPGFRQLCWAGMVFVSCMCIATMLVAIFACRPVAGFYDMNIRPTCIDDLKFYLATAILNIVTDLYILVLPIPMVWRLNTNMNKKFAISAMFMLGGLTFVVSIVRIVCSLHYNYEDPTYSVIGIAYSTPAEICLGIMVASAPTWRPVWSYTVYIVQSIFRGSKGGRESFNLSTVHSKACSNALAGHTTVEYEDEVPLSELPRKGSVTKDDRERNMPEEHL